MALNGAAVTELMEARRAMLAVIIKETIVKNECIGLNYWKVKEIEAKDLSWILFKPWLGAQLYTPIVVC